jgi:aryl-alcohol dehydrogenase-like predicted oxidoreductase
VASKCGIKCFDNESGVDNSASHIKQYIEGTIERLGFTPDLYYLHRIDPHTPLSESITALDATAQRGQDALHRAQRVQCRDAAEGESEFVHTWWETGKQADIKYSREDRRSASRVLRL